MVGDKLQAQARVGTPEASAGAVLLALGRMAGHTQTRTIAQGALEGIRYNNAVVSGNTPSMGQHVRPSCSACGSLCRVTLSAHCHTTKSAYTDHSCRTATLEVQVASGRMGQLPGKMDCGFRLTSSSSSFSLSSRVLSILIRLLCAVNSTPPALRICVRLSERPASHVRTSPLASRQIRSA